ncbi:pentapeptide repeat-containing protein [Candidatus Galacturonibacter soehngenii]|uniref:Pentapeptide repeat-containing protein n=1 Tax=Candidatus Galacturonatibacter soehngenii TaxID=2307010 RepID=A0A7V7UBX9_9FIRM|nr:pentapeptide repeat-containing protein [Candidatus Galacturonibacter soehngenii]KAB1438558.1 pentapeptide repeat-containing protein [Candidatus Galacturonibacter soehngenii]MBA4685594.1 pentapeptide repeat-containing protein [Candidatus Galacturonibacter soehngenii]
MKLQKPSMIRELTQISDTEEIIEILQIARREEKEIERLHIKGCFLMEVDASGNRLQNVIFENVRFSECNFYKSTFIDVIFVNCDLSNCDFKEGYFNRCEFINDKALGARFGRSIFKDVLIKESNFEFTDLSETNLSVVELVASNFKNASLSGCKLKNLLCNQVDFVQTNFFKTPLKGIDFTNSLITGIIVSDTGMELRGAKVDLYQAAELAKLFGVIIK